jgi:hypothetical protein
VLASQHMQQFSCWRHLCASLPVLLPLHGCAVCALPVLLHAQSVRLCTFGGILLVCVHVRSLGGDFVAMVDRQSSLHMPWV